MDMSDSVSAAVILAVGDLACDHEEALKFPESDKIHYVDFNEVTAEKIATLLPMMVVSPLMSHSFDCLDLAARLQALGYRGKFRVLAPNIAKPSMVKAEIAAHAPHLEVEILSLAPDEPKRVI